MTAAAMQVLTTAPPGGEDLALRALSCALHARCLAPLIQAADELLRGFAEEGGGLAAAAGSLGAWWQLVRPSLFEKLLVQQLGKQMLYCCAMRSVLQWAL